MTLGFKETFPWGEPTNFREKILAGVGYVTYQNAAMSISRGLSIETFNHLKTFKSKIHTFRADPHDRWKAGRKIEMVYRGAGYKIKDHFNKDIPELAKCVSVQRINIKNYESWMDIVIDDRPLKDDEIDRLVSNDGFDSFDQFCKWFKADFTGKIIHWTDLRY